MSTPKCTTLDFETAGIDPRPEYPPKPVGLAIRERGSRKVEYMAWGHPEGNNCGKEQVERRLKAIYKSGVPLLFQNGNFDIDVSDVHMGTGLPAVDKVHDTKFQIFLHDPYASSYSLKPSANRILGIKPEEQEAVRDWILANLPEAKGKTKKWRDWGRYICRAPGGLVGKYAIGDITRTDGLHNFIYPTLVKRGMLKAYEREQQLSRVLLLNERDGIRVNTRMLEQDVAKYRAALEYADNWLRRTLDAPGLNVDSDEEMADALERAGVVSAFKLTAKGHRSTSKKNLTPDMFTNKRVYMVFSYRNKLSTCLGTFMEPWLRQAQRTNGWVHTSWNQVLGEGGGARTGRMSSTPNFQNVPKDFEDKDPNYKHPYFLSKLPPLPLMRVYMLADTDKEVWGRRDINQQELRLTAHFEDGDLARRYNENPRFDLHQLVIDGVHEITDILLTRSQGKIVNFQDIYGGGATALSIGLGVTNAIARKIKDAKRALMPDFAQLEKDIKAIANGGDPIETWGGREYYVQPPGYSKKYKRHMTYDYKLLNYLIQGSAADMTKEILIRYHAHPKRQARLIVCVHDEFNISMHPKLVKQEMRILKEVIESIELGVPVLSDGETGVNWGTLTKYKDVA